MKRKRKDNTLKTREKEKMFERNLYMISVIIIKINLFFGKER